MADSLDNIGKINTELKKTSKSLEDISTKVVNLSKVADTQLNSIVSQSKQATKAIKQAVDQIEYMNQTGVKNEHKVNPFGYITKGLDEMRDKIGMFGKYYSDTQIKIQEANKTTTNSFGSFSKEMGIALRKITDTTRQMNVDIKQLPNEMVSAISRLNMSLSRVGSMKIDNALKIFDANKLKVDAEIYAQEVLSTFTKIKSVVGSSTTQIKQMLRESLNTKGLYSNDALEKMQKALSGIVMAEIEVQEQSDALKNITKESLGYSNAINNVGIEYTKIVSNLDRLQNKYAELEVKKRAGLITEEQYQAQAKLLIKYYDELTKKKQEYSRIDISKASAEMHEKEIQRLKEEQRALRKKAEAETKERKAREKEEKETAKRIADEQKKQDKLVAEQERELKRKIREEEKEYERQQKEYERQKKQAEKERIKAEKDAQKQRILEQKRIEKEQSVLQESRVRKLKEIYGELDNLKSRRNKIKEVKDTRNYTQEELRNIKAIDAQIRKLIRKRELLNKLLEDGGKSVKKAYDNSSALRLNETINRSIMLNKEWVLSNAKNAQSYNQLKFAADNIRSAMNKLDPKSKDWRDLNKELKRVTLNMGHIQRRMNQVRGTMGGLLDVAGSLTGAFGLLWATDKIWNFMMGVVQVTGKLELEYRSMQAIVKDKLYSDQIYQETLVNALKSPFEIKDLLTYTKQLAAYRIENEKLVDTTKRLADVSAGLGVDMGRIVLAYGQVKAANYLRASEVRQFTEAGIDMYGELARYFSQIENIEVSTADVIERVTKRMVTFADVEEVFRRMTDESGTFYNMQEVQSETITGLISKLKDAATLFKNSIGTSKGGIFNAILGFEDNQDAIKFSLNALIDLLTNFEKWEGVLRGATILLVIYISQTRLASKTLSRFGRSLLLNNRVLEKFSDTLLRTKVAFRKIITETNATTGVMRKAATATKGLGKALLSLLMANKVAVLLTIFAGIAIHVRKARAEVDELNEALSDMHVDSDNNVQQYIYLAHVVRDTTKSYEEQEKALESLKRQFGDMLPTYMTERKYITENTDKYREATLAIREYVAAKSKEGYIQNVSNKAETTIQNQQSKLTRKLVKDTNMIRADIVPIIEEFRYMIEDGFLSEDWLKDVDFENFANLAKEKQEQIIDEIKANFIKYISKKKGKDEADAIRNNLNNTFNQWVEDIIVGKNKIDEAMSLSNFGSDNNNNSYFGDELYLTEELSDEYDKLISKREKLISQRNEYAKNQNFGAYNDTINELKEVDSQLKSIGDLAKANAMDFEMLQQFRKESVDDEVANFKRLGDELKQLSAKRFKAQYDDSVYWGEAEEKEYQEHLKKMKEIIEKFNTDPNNKLLDPLKMIGSEAEWNTQLDLFEKNVLKKFIDKIKQKYPKLFGYVSGVNVDPMPHQWLLDKVIDDEHPYGLSKLNEDVDAQLNKAKNYRDLLKEVHGEWLENNQLTQEGVRKGLSVLTTMDLSDLKTSKQYGEILHDRVDELKVLKKYLVSDDKDIRESNFWSTYADYLEGLNPQQMEATITHLINVINKQANIYDPQDEKNKTGRIRDVWTERLNLIKKMRDSFQDAEKEMKSASAMKQVKDSYTEAFTELFGDLGVTMDDLDLSNDKAIARWMENDLMKASNLLKGKDLTKFMTFMAQMRVTFQIDESIRRDFEQEMDGMFDDYEVSLNLSKLNIPKSEVSKIFGVDFTELYDVRDALENWKKGQLQRGNEYWGRLDEEMYKKYLDKINEYEDKAQAERVEKYVKYLEIGMSERMKLEMEYVSKIAELNSIPQLDKKTKDRAKENLNKEFQDQMKTLNWNEFKGSSYYVNMMEELESKSFYALDILKKKLIELKNSAQNIPTEALKEIVTTIGKIESLQAIQKPLKMIKDSLKVIRDGEFMSKKDVDEKLDKLNQYADYYDKQKKTIEDVLVLRDEEQRQLNEMSSIETKLGTTITDLVGDSEDPIATLVSLLQKYQSSYNELEEDDSNYDEKSSALFKKIVLLKELIVAYTKYSEIKSKQEILGDDGSEDSSKFQNELDKTNKLIKENNKDIDETSKKGKAWDNLIKGITQVGKKANVILPKVKDSFNSVFDSIEALGVESNELTEGWKDFGNTVFDIINNQLFMIPTLIASWQAAGIAINSAMGIIGLIAIALTMVMQLIGALAKLHDSKIEKKITEYKGKVDELTQAYDRLQKQIDKTFKDVDYLSYHNDALQNIEETIQAINAQNNAERKKKKSDENFIKDNEKEIENLKDKAEELNQKMIEVFGGIGEDNYRSFTEQFVSAWKDAFLQTGDGLDALQEHFDEFLLDWFEKQATMRVASKLLEPLFQQVDDALATDSDGQMKLTREELDAIRENAQSIFPELNQSLIDLFNTLGMGGSLSGSLSGLSKSIQGITEAQANILEAYLNSIRAMMADSNAKITQIANTLINPDAPNPMLAEMRSISRYNSAIYDLLSSVVSSQHPSGGHCIRVLF